MKKVSIIILNWNGKELTKNCLESIRENTDYPNYEVIVIDQGSSDGSVEMIEKEFGDEIRLIKNRENIGFAAGNNQGMEIASGDYFFMVNNDTLVTRGWLKAAVEMMESRANVASVGATLITPDGAVQDGGEDGEADTVCGAAMMLNREVTEKIGRLDAENFSPVYGEETDWNYRAKNAGFKVLQSGKSRLVHFGSVDTTKNTTFEFQYVLLNTHRLKAMLYNDSVFTFPKRVPGLGLIFVQSFKQGVTHWLLKSYWNNIKNLRCILYERRKRKDIAKKVRRELRNVKEV
jgi:GT2 family glycosyltransferase